ncbi:hypothetical protein BDA96_10G145200 [Sorghum bicolor]|uniref:Uncharacterized protein n=1 Tax=Sorghum bicolor TaxID=4558 RepID=A0A921U0A1_SORBI|nr:hypothetical protein BDA96_10G145200 [Sorghum bicolor]
MEMLAVSEGAPSSVATSTAVWGRKGRRLNQTPETISGLWVARARGNRAPVQIRVEERCSPSSRSAGQRRSSGWLARRRDSCCRRSPRGHAHRRRALLLGEKDKLRLTGCTVKTVASLSAVQSPAVGTEQERRVGRGVERHEQERRVAAGTEQEQERRVRPLGPLNNPRSSWPAGKQRDVKVWN